MPCAHTRTIFLKVVDGHSIEWCEHCGALKQFSWNNKRNRFSAAPRWRKPIQNPKPKP